MSGRLRQVALIAAALVVVFVVIVTFTWAAFSWSTPATGRQEAAAPASKQSAPAQKPAGSAKPTPSATPTPKASPLQGLHVLLDPGHNGGNAANSRRINRQVPNGRGGTKACNTTGTASNSGFPEHELNWLVAQEMRAQLEAAGAKVSLTRDSDTGVGPCVDERGQAPQNVGADVALSLHANGSEGSGPHGFFVIMSSPALNEAQGAPSRALADAVVAEMSAAGFARSTAFPSGISQRSDIAGVNFAQRPMVMVEMGEMRNPGDAAQMQSEDGRKRYATALVSALERWAKNR